MNCSNKNFTACLVRPLRLDYLRINKLFYSLVHFVVAEFLARTVDIRWYGIHDAASQMNECNMHEIWKGISMHNNKILDAWWVYLPDNHGMKEKHSCITNRIKPSSPPLDQYWQHSSSTSSSVCKVLYFANQLVHVIAFIVFYWLINSHVARENMIAHTVNKWYRCTVSFHLATQHNSDRFFLVVFYKLGWPPQSGTVPGRNRIITILNVQNCVYAVFPPKYCIDFIDWK